MSGELRTLAAGSDSLWLSSALVTGKRWKRNSSGGEWRIQQAAVYCTDRRIISFSCKCHANTGCQAVKEASANSKWSYSWCKEWRYHAGVMALGQSWKPRQQLCVNSNSYLCQETKRKKEKKREQNRLIMKMIESALTCFHDWYFAIHVACWLFMFTFYCFLCVGRSNPYNEGKQRGHVVETQSQVCVTELNVKYHLPNNV